jgi:hypothetical protein
MKKLKLSAIASFIIAIILHTSVLAGPPATIDQLDWMTW